MPKRKLDLNPVSNQKNDASIVRTLKKLTSAVANSEHFTNQEETNQLAHNQEVYSNLTPALTQVVTQVSTPVNIPTLTPSLTSSPVEEQPSTTTQGENKKQKSFRRAASKHQDQITNLAEMARWHSETEQKVYKAMYQQSKTHNTNELYFTFLSLAEKTGFRNPRTIRAAIQGLIAKRSIAEVINKHGEHLGIRYRVFSPEEIIQNRIEANINIDFQSKKIL